jgi:hypothetical protein
LNHKIPDTLLDTPPNIPTSSKKSNQSGNWQVIATSNLVRDMLTTMKQKYDGSNGNLSCSEEVNIRFNTSIAEHLLNYM